MSNSPRLTRRGRTYYAYVYENGIRKQVSTKCTDRRAAEEKARELEREYANPDHTAQKKATLADALTLLFEDRDAKVADGKRSKDTAEFYRKKAGHLSRLFEHDSEGRHQSFHLLDLKPRHVDAYCTRRREEGVAANTISKELITLRAALKLARRAGIWQGEIDAILPVAYAPEYKPRTRYLTREELSLLLGQLLPDRAARVAFIVATSACWRETELAQRGDITRDLSTVLIRGTKRASRYRTVPIVTEEQLRLLTYAQKHAEGVDGLLFLKWQNVRRDLHAACDRANISPPCSPNDLRRTCATWLRAAGTPTDLIAPVMGHKDGRMVERVYGRLDPHLLAERIRAAIGPEQCRSPLGSRDDKGYIESDTQGADCINSASDTVDGVDPVRRIRRPVWVRGGGLENEKSRSNQEDLSGFGGGFKVPRDGVEPPTRGFSVPSTLYACPRRARDSRRFRYTFASKVHHPSRKA